MLICWLDTTTIIEGMAENVQPQLKINEELIWEVITQTMIDVKPAGAGIGGAMQVMYHKASSASQ